MADELTPRLGLPIYTSGASQHPTREDFNDRMRLIDRLAASTIEGEAADRPLPGVTGRFFYDTAAEDLWYDTGEEWVPVVRLGNDGPGRPLNIDGNGAEGSSRRAARADHVHPLPLATSGVHGAMRSTDKALLDTATSSSTGNSLVQRNGSGQTSVGAPTAAAHAANRGYVDQQVSTRAPSSHTHNASDVNAGVLAPARLPAATTSAQGALGAADKRKLDDATAATTGSTLMFRNPGGTVNTADPTATTHAANKRYVDLVVSNLEGTAVIGSSLGDRDLDGVTQPGLYYQNANASATVGRNYPSGGLYAGTLDVQQYNGNANYLVQEYTATGTSGRSTRRYTRHTRNGGSTWHAWDEQAYMQDINAHTHNASDVNAGVFNLARIPSLPASRTTSGAFAVARIPNLPASKTTSGTFAAARLPAATRSAQGAQSAAHYQMLDDATASATGNALARRNATGQIAVSDPNHATHAATRRYVDDNTWQRGNVGARHVDTILDPGEYTISAQAWFVPANGYPINGTHGSLTVHIGHGSSRMQDLVDHTSQRRFYRSRGTSQVWSAWQEYGQVPEPIPNLFRSTSSGVTVDTRVGLYTPVTDTLARIDCNLVVYGVTVPAGSQNTQIGTVNSKYCPITSIPIHGFGSGNDTVTVSLQPAGEFQIRHITTRSANWNQYFQLNYLVRR